MKYNEYKKSFKNNSSIFPKSYWNQLQNKEDYIIKSINSKL